MKMCIRDRDNADTIIGNMDTSIFLGGKEPTTLKELAAVLGKETIDTYNTGESRGRETSHSLNYQKLGKELMSQDELAVMDGGKCILQPVSYTHLFRLVRSTTAFLTISLN